MALLCEDTVADAGGLAPMDVESLNHRLRRNVGSAFGYERRSISSSLGPPGSHCLLGVRPCCHPA